MVVEFFEVVVDGCRSFLLLVTAVHFVHPLPVYSRELHHQNIPQRLYRILDRIGTTVSGYRPDGAPAVGEPQIICLIVNGIIVLRKGY